MRNRQTRDDTIAKLIVVCAIALLVGLFMYSLKHISTSIDALTTEVRSIRISIKGALQ